MRIERIRIEGFGSLSGVDLSWPEGKLLLVVDPNETGKTTLCEAIFSALYGLGGRMTAARTREIRRPKSGARLGVGLELSAGGGRWTVDRDLEAGTVRILDRDRNVDETRRFMRGGGRDAFGETLSGLSSALFRTTAYVAQNTLDKGELDAALTLELARIADAGGGEASVARSLMALDDARARMRDATTGPSVSVDTEIARLEKRLAERRADAAKREDARRRTSEAAASVAELAAAADGAGRAAALLELAALAGDRDGLRDRVAFLAEAGKRLAALEDEAERLARSGAIPEGALESVDRLLEERGERPARLEAERAELARAERAEAEEGRRLSDRFGPLAALLPEDRHRLAAALAARAAVRGERAASTAEVDDALAAFAADGLAEDLERLEALQPDDREFLSGAEDERRTLELAGVQLDRRAAAAASGASIAAAERRDRLSGARSLSVSGGVLLIAAVGLFAGSRVSQAAAILGAFAVGLLLVGAFTFVRGSRHGLAEEKKRKDEEGAARREAAQIRKKLSDVRLRLDRTARGAGLEDGASLLRAQKRVASAASRRQTLASRRAVQAAAAARAAALDEEIAGVAGERLRTSTLEMDAEVRSQLASLEEASSDAARRSGVLAGEKARLEKEEASLERIGASLLAALGTAGALTAAGLDAALFDFERRRRDARRRRELLDLEIPARREAASETERADAEARAETLSVEIDRRLEEIGVEPPAIPPTASPEAARREAAKRRAERKSLAERQRVATTRLASAMREASAGAREGAEALADAETALERARLHLEALDLARRSLADAASSAYADFRRGLGEASRDILARWYLPYEGLEFDDQLRLTVAVRGGGMVTSREVAAALSTGAREQLHLTARLAALRYLGTGERGVPLLLDDPLTNADDARFLAVMRFLVEHVLDERPVLVVSCHGWRHERLLADLPEPLAQRIHRVSLVPNSFSARAFAPETPSVDAPEGAE